MINKVVFVFPIQRLLKWDRTVTNAAFKVQNFTAAILSKNKTKQGFQLLWKYQNDRLTNLKLSEYVWKSSETDDHQAQR